MLKTVTSPRFRKLTFFIIPPLPSDKGKIWRSLDGEITALAKRVNATVAGDALEVLFSSYSTAVGALELSAVRAVLPRTASDACVSLRVENQVPRSSSA